MEFKQIRENLELTLFELAQKLDVEINLVNQWESGELPVPKVVILALCYLEKIKNGNAAENGTRAPDMIVR